MIIQCPSCSTRFSVDSAQIAGVNNPKFHCSRCNNLFQTDSIETNKVNPPREINLNPHHALSDPQEKLFSSTLNSAEQLELLPSASDSNSNLEPRSTDVEDSFDGVSGPIKANWPDPTTTSVYSVDMKATLEQLNASSDANKLNSRINTRTSRWADGRKRHKAREALNPIKNQETVQAVANSSIHISSVQENLDQPLITTKTKTLSRPPILTIDETIEEIPLSIDRKKNVPDLINSRKIYDKLTTFFSNNIFQILKPMILIISFPLAFGLLFATSGVSENSSPSFFARLFSSDGIFGFNSPIVPPSGVTVLGLRSDIITLDDGQQVLEISGKAVNTTTSIFEDVQIEGKLFDETNALLQKEIVALTNGLSNASRLGSLKKEAIAKLQERSSLIKLKLNPNDSTNFRLVLAEFPAKTKWFSARVYSVKKSNAI